ncbi:MAG: dihydroxy-acid dehydratase [Burkholderiaceae bacterium]|jgi:dihydroxy-acid dehydratase|nr:dihydroxy-acid dehydratase [Burkholderiaceae bacterium]MBP6707557.1 dihydroxy-acid dehydratase [Accumulibacter sp.]MBP6813244.1 dihydroxy-acid dehydratase [Burkholderiaceae bacterium]MBP7658366.1 dihydroxy-acid dehydratase [Burkholderiaceae bacterium]
MKKDSPIFWTKSRVELRAAGFEPDHAAQTNAVVTIASAYTNAHRCNNRVRTITDLLVEILAQRGGQGLIVGAPAVSDALTQGTPTAGYSLVSRDVAADCFEIGHYAHHGEAMIVISGCDKTGAAALMPLARTNAFGLVLYPGTSSPGRVPFEPWASKGNNLTIMDYAEGRASQEAGRITAQELLELERNVMPGSGTCGAMFTANTMSTIAEAIGMMLPRGASHPADYDAQSDIHADVRAQAHASVDALYRLIAAGIRPLDIMTERAFENAITTVYAMGGSTNMYLHLLAIAREAQVPITIERIQQVGERVPLICNLQPHGQYAMASLHALGGVPVVMKELLRHGFLHGDLMTVTGKTVAENLADVPTLEALGAQDVVVPVSRPTARPNNHISVLKGNIAPESCLLKLSGKTLEKGEFRGTARVFESEADTMQAIRAGQIVPGNVIVVRNVGPVGGPGMPEMVMLTIQLQGRGLAEDVALITDGRFSGVSHGILIGHISPEAARGGPIAAVRDGDTIVIDPGARTLNLDVPDAEIARRMADWRAPDRADKARPGSVHDKYIRLVSSAHYGCVL